jgi:hypothetical protein
MLGKVLASKYADSWVGRHGISWQNFAALYFPPRRTFFKEKFTVYRQSLNEFRMFFIEYVLEMCNKEFLVKISKFGPKWKRQYSFFALFYRIVFCPNILLSLIYLGRKFFARRFHCLDKWTFFVFRQFVALEHTSLRNNGQLFARTIFRWKEIHLEIFFNKLFFRGKLKNSP